MQKNENSLNIMNSLRYCCNKCFYSGVFPVILAAASYLIYKYLDINFIIMLTIYLCTVLYWLFKLIVLPKNRSDKYGIVFLINNGEFYNEDVHSMFKKIQFELQDDFKILVFNNNFIRKLDTSEKNRNIIFKKKYSMVINLFSLVARENSESVCALTNKEITFKTPVKDMDKNIISNLQKDFCLGFKHILKLSKSNSFMDISQNADMMSLSIRYFVSIIYILFNQVDAAERQLKSMDFSNLDCNDKIVKYLRRNCIKRYAEVYYSRVINEMDKYDYLYKNDELNKILSLTSQLEKYVSSESSLTDFRYLVNDIKAKLYFAMGKYYESYGCLTFLHKKFPNDYSVLLSMAFIKLNLGDVKGLEIYKQLSRKNNIDINVINGCIAFIDNALKNTIHSVGTLVLCRGLLMYYWVDESDGQKNIKDSMNLIKNTNILSYVSGRFNCQILKKAT